MAKKKKKYNDYSTNPEWNYEENPFGGIQLDQDPGTMKLHVQYERKGRAGKEVTMVYGWRGSTTDLEALATILKKGVGTGGSVKNDEIIIQGKHVEKVKALLSDQGYRVV